MTAAIRPIEPSDEQQFVLAARRSTHLHKPWISAPCEPEAFAKYIARLTSPANFGFIVYEPASNNIVGAINLTNIILGAFCSGYLGYFAFAGHEGKGYMKAGLSAVVRHAFKVGGLHRLEANIQPGNTASIVLARSCGFTKEGYSPAYLKIGGRWRDHERWALVRGKKNTG